MIFIGVINDIKAEEFSVTIDGLVPDTLSYTLADLRHEFTQVDIVAALQVNASKFLITFNSRSNSVQATGVRKWQKQSIAMLKV